MWVLRFGGRDGIKRGRKESVYVCVYACVMGFGEQGRKTFAMQCACCPALSLCYLLTHGVHM